MLNIKVIEMVKALLFNKYTAYLAITTIILGLGIYQIKKWHYGPLSAQQTEIARLNNQKIIVTVKIESLEAEKEKLISDMSIIYDNGYYAGIKEGYSYEKNDIATIHSNTFNF